MEMRPTFTRLTNAAPISSGAKTSPQENKQKKKNRSLLAWQTRAWTSPCSENSADESTSENDIRIHIAYGYDDVNTPSSAVGRVARFSIRKEIRVWRTKTKWK